MQLVPLGVARLLGSRTDPTGRNQVRQFLLG
ncbi:MAG: hypothetical protein QOF10_2986 [Kribbellaceae bacterium]|jgi:hypothetical protein|nr:hypothetical protein [Kribbellaceae bacterium]